MNHILNVLFICLRIFVSGFHSTAIIFINLTIRSFVDLAGVATANVPKAEREENQKMKANNSLQCIKIDEKRTWLYENKWWRFYIWFCCCVQLVHLEKKGQETKEIIGWRWAGDGTKRFISFLTNSVFLLEWFKSFNITWIWNGEYARFTLVLVLVLVLAMFCWLM